ALRRHAVPQGVIDDARLVVTELLGNALRYARPTGSGCLVLAVDVLPDGVRLAVSDGGSTTLPTLLHPPTLAPSGRGLGIVGTLTRECGVLDDADGNTVFGVLAIA
ncbi:MAG: ATP-binding protein, partial [Lapillicoccus sp.]